MKAFVLTLALLAAGSVPAFAQTPVNAGDLLIYRVGGNTGTDTLSSAGTSVFVDEWTTSGQYVRTYNTGDFASGTATSEGQLTASPNGQYVAFTGYSAGGAGVAGTTSAANPRAVSVLNTATGGLTTTNFTDFSTGNNPRSAVVANNGTDLWMVGGAGGIRYGTTGGTTSTQLSTTTTNLRDVQIVNGQLYVSSSSGATRLAAVGSGMPTGSGQTITNLPGVSSSNSTSPYSFFLADLNSTVAGVDTLYVADDTGATGGIQKFSLVGGTWTFNNTITSAAGVRGLTGTVTGGNVQLFGTTGGSGATGGGSLYAFGDASGYDANMAGSVTTLATNLTLEAALGGTGSDYSFRGVALVPIPEPSTYAMILGVAGFAGVLLRRHRPATHA